MKELAIHPVFEASSSDIARIARLREKISHANIFHRSPNGPGEVFSNRRLIRDIYANRINPGHDMPARIDIQRIVESRHHSDKWRILFLAPVRREAGIYETLEAFEILRRIYPMLELVIAGEGAELPAARAFVEERAIPDVVFTDFTRTNGKFHLLRNAHILCNPAYSEDIPDTVKEAMAFGLPVVARMVGGIGDFFLHGEHGFATSCKAPCILAGHIEQLLLDRELWHSIAVFNYQYARAHFYGHTGLLGRPRIAFKHHLYDNLAAASPAG